MEEKLIIALFAIVVSWIFAQVTEYLKYWWSGKVTKNGLITELYDIQNQLQRVVLIYARQLQIFALNGMEPSASLAVPNMYYQQYFKNAFAHLNQEQRISYQLIHASLEKLNTQNVSLSKFFEKSYEEMCTSQNEERKSAIIKVWGDRVIALYKNTMNIRWHIDYHVKNQDLPVFDIMGSMHESYVKFQEELYQNVRDILKNAKKSLSLKDFEKIYDEETFEHHRKNV